MITNFEQITMELSEAEIETLKGLIAGFSKRTKDNPIKAPEIVKSMKVYCQKNNLPKFTDVRLRKMVNYIRSNSLLPVIATSKGYYVSYDEKEISEQIKSLQERANSISDCIFGLKKYLT